jgi:D-alanyl-D-alanine dipeptidase
MCRFERKTSASPWQQVGTTVTINLGRTGLAWGSSSIMETPQTPKVKREGDGRSPAGIFPILKAFGHPKAPSGYAADNLDFLVVTDEQCVDDKASEYYNQIVEPDKVGGVSWDSAETMKIDLYRLGLVVGHNCPKAVAGMGSCIFFHLQRGPGKPTAGCTSMRDADLRELVLWLRRDKKPVVVQLPEKVYRAQGDAFPSWGK